jgi:hypothetical protein
MTLQRTPTAEEVESAKADLKFVRGQILPRSHELLGSWAPYAAFVSGLALALALPALPAANMHIMDAAGYGLTFASISMGACFSAIVLSIGLPGTNRLRLWSLRKGATPGKSALSELIFVLVWAALWQVFLIITCVIAIAFGGDYPLGAPSGAYPHMVSLILGLWIFFYAVYELLIVVQTLTQVGVMIIAEERIAARMEAEETAAEGNRERGGPK